MRRTGRAQGAAITGSGVEGLLWPEHWREAVRWIVWRKGRAMMSAPTHAEEDLQHRCAAVVQASHVTIPLSPASPFLPAPHQALPLSPSLPLSPPLPPPLSSCLSSPSSSSPHEMQSARSSSKAMRSDSSMSPMQEENRFHSLIIPRKGDESLSRVGGGEGGRGGQGAGAGREGGGGGGGGGGRTEPQTICDPPPPLASPL